MDINKDLILNALRSVIEPDLKKDLVTLNMIDNLEINDKTISFTIVLTTPACPLKESMKNACIKVIKEITGNEYQIDIKFSSKVLSQKKISINKLPGVKNIIAVASGKGGVGKSTVAANLAVAMALKGAKVALTDADIYGPSIPMMFGVDNEKPMVREVDGKMMMVPIEKYGVKISSIGFLIDNSKALIWRGPMAANALSQLLTETDWGEIDYMILDLPPGTGDIQLTLVQSFSLSGAIIVSTPQEVALTDARKAIGMFQQESINVPILGVVENMSYFIPDDNPDKKYYIFGKNGGQRLSEAYNIPFLGGIPLIENICLNADLGKPSVLNSEITAQIFADISEKIAQQISVNNFNH